MTKVVFPIVSLTVLASLFTLSSVSAHCQVPCGIYDDHARVESMLEDAATAAKAVVKLESLSGKSDVQSLNQVVRWVSNKESHAQSIIDTISDYFLTQRVKPTQEDYAVRLEKHHQVILLAMKAKQKADTATLSELTEAIAELEVYYPAAE